MKKLTAVIAAAVLFGAASPALAGIYSKYQLPWAPGTCVYFTGYTYKVGPC